MAKFAKVTYGTHGDTGLYTYVVNDNIRTGDYMQPSVKHYKSGKIFATTAIVQQTAKETSKAGQNMKQELQSKGREAVNAYTGKELGIQPERGEGGRFATSGGALGKTIKDQTTGLRTAPPDKKFTASRYVQQTREANVLARQNKAQTFDEYAKPFMDNQGENQ